MLNQTAAKALVIWAAFYERFEAANEDLCDIDKKFDVEFGRVEILTEKAAEAQREADQAMAKLQPYEESSSYLGGCV